MVNQRGFSPIVIILVVILLSGLIIGASLYIKYSRSSNELSAKNRQQVKTASSPSPDNSILQEKQLKKNNGALDVGKHSILLKRGSVLLLPSGSKLDLGKFYFDDESKNYEDNTISLVSFLKVFHKGYIYNINKSNCTSESVWHDDYSTQELKECTLEIDISQDKPEVIPYNQFTKRFSSLERSNDNYNPVILPPSPITNSQNEPFLTVIPPYTQLYRDSGLQKYTYTTPIGDTVWVYTNYGYKSFKFNLPDDLFNKASNTQQIGPLTITLKVEGLSCYPPYMRSSGECNNPREYPVYNKVDFVIDITQNGRTPAEVKILDYKW